MLQLVRNVVLRNVVVRSVQRRARDDGAYATLVPRQMVEKGRRCWLVQQRVA
jgi:hypothetical protein